MFGTVPKSERKIIEKGKIYTPDTHRHHHSLSWLGTGISTKSGWVKLVLWDQTSPLSEIIWSCKSFLHVSKMSNPYEQRYYKECYELYRFLHLYWLFLCFSHGKKTGSATGKYKQW